MKKVQKFRKISNEQKESNIKRWSEVQRPKLLNHIKSVSRRIYDIVSPEDFEPSLSFVDFENCYIYGEVGNGKTIVAVGLMMEWARIRYENSNTNIGCIFTTLHELLQELRNSYNTKDITEQDIIDKYSNIAMLVIDEFGAVNITDWSFQMLYMIINKRYNNYKTTIYTSNGSLEQLAENLGDDRLSSRIEHSCGKHLFHITAKSKRKIK